MKRSAIKMSPWQRAEKAGRSSFKLEEHYQDGTRTIIQSGLRSYIQSLITLAWKRGYDAGRRSK